VIGAQTIVVGAATDEILWRDYQRHWTKQLEKTLEAEEAEPRGAMASRPSTRSGYAGDGGRLIVTYAYALRTADDIERDWALYSQSFVDPMKKRPSVVTLDTCRNRCRGARQSRWPVCAVVLASCIYSTTSRRGGSSHDFGFSHARVITECNPFTP
jgi:hypothetical protein